MNLYLNTTASVVSTLDRLHYNWIQISSKPFPKDRIPYMGTHPEGRLQSTSNILPAPSGNFKAARLSSLICAQTQELQHRRPFVIESPSDHLFKTQLTQVSRARQQAHKHALKSLHLDFRPLLPSY